MQQDVIILMNHLLQYNEVSLDSICDMLSITKRQLFYRLDKINDLLEDSGFDQIEVTDDCCRINNKQKRYIREYLMSSHALSFYELSDDERISVIYILMFIQNEFVSMQTFISVLKVSKTTVHSSLKKLRHDLNEKGLDFEYTREHGYKLLGPELELRNYLTNVIVSLLSEAEQPLCLNVIVEEYHLPTYEYLSLIVEELANHYEIVYVGNRIQDFIYILIFLSVRIKNVKTQEAIVPTDDERKNLISSYSKEYKFSKHLLEILDLKDVQKFDLNYICAWMLGISIGNYDDYTKDRNFLSEIIKKVMDRFELLSACTYGDSFDIFKQLYAHFRPAYYRLQFHISIVNPLKERIQNEYQQLYYIVEKSLKPFNELFGTTISDDEVAFFTMHFATIYTNDRRKQIIEKPKAVVVCTNGIASSVLLSHELSSLLPQLEIVKTMDYTSFKNNRPDVDLIFTTTSSLNIYGYGIPVIQVDILMDEKEKFRVIHEVESYLKMNGVNHGSKVDEIMQVINKYADVQKEEEMKKEIISILYKDKLEVSSNKKVLHLKDILKEENIIFVDSVESPTDAIKQAAKMLYLNDYIDKEYVDKLLEADPMSYVIAPGIALPHTSMPQAVNRIGISLCVLDKPIQFGESQVQVQFIICLSAIDQSTHILAMNELLEVLNDEQFYHIVGQKDASLVASFIEEHQIEQTILS